MLIRHRGRSPVVDPGAYVAPNATLVGDVRVGPGARILYGAVLDAEGATVEVGAACVVSEQAVLRATAVGAVPRPVVLGDHVFVGPHATLLGCTVGRCCYLATNATVLHGARLGAGAVVAVGALAHAGAVLPSEMFVPPMTVAIGDPARVYPTDRPDELAEAVRGVNFAQAAFGVTHDWTDRIARYERIAEVRGAEYAAHLDDEIVG
ncbi:MAG: acyltransferase [Actinobacteria bacterium]|nr:MAG: acyltransferase [Actinomycetota bacterium]